MNLKSILLIVKNVENYQIGTKSYTYEITSTELNRILNEYDSLSLSAVKSFKNELNCNIFFDPFLKKITEIINSENKK